MFDRPNKCTGILKDCQKAYFLVLRWRPVDLETTSTLCWTHYPFHDFSHDITQIILQICTPVSKIAIPPPHVESKITTPKQLQD